MTFAIISCAACAHPSPRATCGDGFATLSQLSSGEAPIERKPHRWITAIRVTGVDPALARTLAGGLATEVGMMVSDAPLADDVRRLFKSGVIADARVEVIDETEVEFAVVPRASIDRVVVRGGDPEMARRFRLLVGAPYEPARIQRMADSAQLSYVRGGRLDARVEARASTTKGIAICVAANPGPKLTIGKVTFPGRTAVTEAALFEAMRSTEKVNRVGGTFDPGAFATDKIFLEVEYWDRGYANIKIGEPRMIRRGMQLVIEIPIDEGPIFQFGRISTSHRLDVALSPGELFGRTKVVNAIERLRQTTGVEDVIPRTKVDVASRTIDITFEIQWRWPWHALSHWRSS